MRFRKKIQGLKKERQFKSFLFLIPVIFFFFLVPWNIISQDSIPIAKDFTEEKELKFQDFFFKALSEKSIGNNQRAIENLESCNQILTNNASVFFEFSKNYLLLKNILLAKEYINRALQIENDNIWMLKHSVKVFVADRNFSEAIKIQEKVVVINQKERAYLVRLLFQNREYKKAILLMNTLEKENVLPERLRSLKNNLEVGNSKKDKKEKSNDIFSLINRFKYDKSYKLLEQILQNYLENPNELLKYSNEGISLFPAQPYVYLTKGRALIYLKEYKKALTSLRNGIDFVIDDKMEAKFYTEMAIAYKGLGNLKEEIIYRQKSKKLKI
jgi:tetratricopeptide (TPR) repeat protein